MSEQLDNELKQQYLNAIKIIWDDTPSLRRYGINHITERVVEVMDKVLEEIAGCSHTMAGPHALFENFYAPFGINKWRTILRKSFKVFKKWTDTIKSNRRYRMCIYNVARNHRTDIEDALMGI